MANPIDNLTAALISDIQLGEVEANNLTAVEAVQLSNRGFILLSSEGDLELTDKARRALRRFERDNEIAVATEAVREVIMNMLSEPGSVTQHRAVWNAVGGPDRFDRDTVLQALNALKAEGVLNHHRTSGNNFQIFWKRADDVVSTPDFEMN